MKSSIALSSLVMLIFSGAIMSSSTVAVAQDLTGEESVLFSEIPSVYTASKREQVVTEAPSSVSIITADEIQKYGYRTLAEILASVRSMYTTYDRQYRYLGVRGFARPGDYNTRILIMIDGIRINDAVYDSGIIGTEFMVDVDLIDRIEIVRGPSSSLYGTNAFFGVVNIVTKRGRDLQGVELAGSAGSLETYRGRLTLGKKYSNGFEAMVSGTYFDSKGHEELYYKEFDDPETNYGIARNCDADDYSNFFGKLSYRDFTLQGVWNSRTKVNPTGAYEVIFNDPGTYTNDEQFIMGLMYDHTFENHHNMLARVNYNHYYYYGVYMYSWGHGNFETVTNEDYSKGDWINGELQYSLPFADKHHAVIGAECRINYRQDQGNFDIWEVYLDDSRSSEYWGLFANAEFVASSKLMLNAGLRYDYFETFGGTANPRIALIYDPVERTTLKALYGRAFRAPNAYELYYNDDGYTQKVAGKLEPETINTYELVVEQYFTDRIFGTINGFFYQINDLITLVTDPDDDVLVFSNAAEIEAKGVELGIEGRLDHGSRGRLSYAYVETEDKETGAILTNSPKHVAKVNLITPILQDRLFAAAEVQYLSKRMTLTGNYADDYVVMNLNITTNLFENRIKASFGILNLFDVEYSDPGSEAHLQDMIQQDGRMFRVSLAVTI